jgi:uncharacterized protein YabN with tetrapyrrole methylase and pyrophosphatase domain
MDIFDKITHVETDASDFGFRWEHTGQIMDQINSEIKEVAVHLQDRDQQKLQEEIGDLLHAVFSLTVFCNLDPRTTLENSIDKFAKRLQKVKDIAAQRGLHTLNGKSFAELMTIWNEAKGI